MKTSDIDASLGSTSASARSLPIREWPDADRLAWNIVRSRTRLKPGGTACYLAEVSRDDFARRYGAFLGCCSKRPA